MSTFKPSFSRSSKAVVVGSGGSGDIGNTVESEKETTLLLVRHENVKPVFIHHSDKARTFQEIKPNFTRNSRSMIPTTTAKIPIQEEVTTTSLPPPPSPPISLPSPPISLPSPPISLPPPPISLPSPPISLPSPPPQSSSSLTTTTTTTTTKILKQSKPKPVFLPLSNSTFNFNADKIMRSLSQSSLNADRKEAASFLSTFAAKKGSAVTLLAASPVMKRVTETFQAFPKEVSSFLMYCSTHVNLHGLLKSVGVMDLKQEANSKGHKQWKVAMIQLSLVWINLMGSSEPANCAADTAMLRELKQILTCCGLENPPQQYLDVEWDLAAVLSCVLCMSLSDSNKMYLVENGFCELLGDILQTCSDADAIRRAIRSLWNLGFLEEGRKRIQQMNLEIPKNDNCKDMLSFCNKIDRVVPKKPNSGGPVIICMHSSNFKVSSVLSDAFSVAARIPCKIISENPEGVLESCLEMLESSSCVCFGVSEGLRLSEFCHSIVACALKLKLPLVPVFIQQLFEPEAWLADVCAARFGGCHSILAMTAQHLETSIFGLLREIQGLTGNLAPVEVERKKRKVHPGIAPIVLPTIASKKATTITTATVVVRLGAVQPIWVPRLESHYKMFCPEFVAGPKQEDFRLLAKNGKYAECVLILERIKAAMSNRFGVDSDQVVASSKQLISFCILASELCLREASPRFTLAAMLVHRGLELANLEPKDGNGRSFRAWGCGCMAMYYFKKHKFNAALKWSKDALRIESGTVIKSVWGMNVAASLARLGQHDDAIAILLLAMCNAVQTDSSLSKLQEFLMHHPYQRLADHVEIEAEIIEEKIHVQGVWFTTVWDIVILGFINIAISHIHSFHVDMAIISAENALFLAEKQPSSVLRQAQRILEIASSSPLRHTTKSFKFPTKFKTSLRHIAISLGWEDPDEKQQQQQQQWIKSKAAQLLEAAAAATTTTTTTTTTNNTHHHLPARAATTEPRASNDYEDDFHDYEESPSRTFGRHSAEPTVGLWGK